MNYWQGKRVIITGGSAGLGSVLAKTLFKLGAKLVLSARGTERLEAFATSLDATGDTILPVSADITKQEDVERLFTDGVEWLGGLDLLINCAGRSARSNILNTPPEDFTDLIDLNLTAAVRCTQAAIPHLKKSQGHLVNIGSLASKLATPYHGAYPASKFALAAYTQQLRLVLKDDGVHILLVCPGPITKPEGEILAAVENSSDSELPDFAKRPGGGAKVKAIDPQVLVDKIVAACERRKLELILPGKARLAIVAGAFSARFGDWLLTKFSSSK